MRVLIVSRGSTGDIFPLIALGRALLASGHAVSFSTVTMYADEIRAAGIAFVATPPESDAAEHAEIMRTLARERNPLRNVTTLYSLYAPHLREFIESIEASLETHDILVCSYLFPFLSAVARRRGKPFVVTAFCHVAFPGLDRAPPPLPAFDFAPRKIRHAWADLWHGVGEFLTGVCVRRVAGKALESSGAPLPKRFFRCGADLTLALVSPGLFAPERYLAGGPVYSGYLRWVLPESPELETRLRAFTGGERVPVLNFGSVTFDGAAEKMQKFLLGWPKGKKLVLQSGWAGFTGGGREDILIVTGKVSHEQLFRHASVVAHHGGAGTTAAVLHAGVPQVVVPHLGDQFFWADAVRRLGVGREISSRRWPEKLAGAMDRVARDSGKRARAEIHARTLAGEDGAARAVRELESLAK